MFLKSEYFNEQIIIEGFDKKLLGPISHDLTITRYNRSKYKE